MASAFAVLLQLAAGRSDNPDEGAGVGLIVGIVVLVVVVIATAWFLVGRLASRRRSVRDPGA
jgi:hypothetical protein